MRDEALILRIVECGDWQEAAKVAIDLTAGLTTSPEAIGLIGELQERINTTWFWRRYTAHTLQTLFAEAGEITAAGIWEMLAADPTLPAACRGPAEKAKTALIQYIFDSGDSRYTGRLRHAVKGWLRMADNKDLVTVDLDPFVESHKEQGLKALREPPKAEPPPAHGMVVLTAAGGNQTTSSGKEAQREFAAIIGKTLPLVETPDLTKARGILAGEFPHAVAAIDAILGDLVGRPTIRWRPSLFVGSPGCGKSRLASRIPAVLGLPVTRFDGASASDSAFGGTPRRWSTGEPSVPLEAIRRSGVANPCVFVDEAEKGSTSRHNGNFANSMLPFLESETARAHADPFIQAPAVLRDRLRLLRIPEPTADCLPALCRTLAKEISADRGIDPAWPVELSDFEQDVAAELWSGGSIRRLRSIVEIIISQRNEPAFALRH